MGSRLRWLLLSCNAGDWVPFPYNLDETRFHTFTDGLPACFGAMFGPERRMAICDLSIGEAMIGIKLPYLRTPCPDRRRAPALRRS